MDRPDLIAAIHAAIHAAATSIGLGAPIAHDLAHQVEDRLRVTVGGGDLRYIGKVDRAKRAADIRAAFNGTNIKALAAAHNLTERAVRKIVYTR